MRHRNLPEPDGPSLVHSSSSGILRLQHWSDRADRLHARLLSTQHRSHDLHGRGHRLLRRLDCSDDADSSRSRLLRQRQWRDLPSPMLRRILSTGIRSDFLLLGQRWILCREPGFSQSDRLRTRHLPTLHRPEFVSQCPARLLRRFDRLDEPDRMFSRHLPALFRPIGMLERGRRTLCSHDGIDSAV